MNHKPFVTTCHRLQPLNESSEMMTLEVLYQPISAGTLRLWVTMMESFHSLYALGNNPDESKDAFSCAVR